jgi:tRNA1Val (adenine37-N6)-methyltransferase
MPNSYFKFKQFTINQDRAAMKVTTDACLFGAWAARSARQSAVGQSGSPGIHHVLDIGTGTGLLSLMMAQQINAEIDAIELDEDAFEQAQQNMASSPWHDNLFVIQGDAKDMAYVLGKEYDIIVSNPPFYENELESPNLKKNRAHHSAGLSLDELLSIIGGILSPDGQFYLLLPYKRQHEAEHLFYKHDLTITHKVFVRQSTKHDHFRIMIAGRIGLSGKRQPVTEEISIWDDQQQYTAEFVDLLKDYYLYL